jgi:hypothetical protein
VVSRRAGSLVGGSISGFSSLGSKLMPVGCRQNHADGIVASHQTRSLVKGRISGLGNVRRSRCQRDAQPDDHPKTQDGPLRATIDGLLIIRP